MAQSSIELKTTPPYPGLALVQDINAALQSLGTDFAGPTDPAGVAGPYMTWADTSSGLIKRRNAANTTWVIEGTLLRAHIPVYAANETPSTNVGPIYINGLGTAEWSDGQGGYRPVPAMRAVIQRGAGSGEWISTMPEFFIDACAAGGGGGGGSGFVGDIRYQGGGGGAGQSILGELIVAPIGTRVSWTVGGAAAQGGAGGLSGGAGAPGTTGGNTVITIHTPTPRTITLNGGAGGAGGAGGGPAYGGNGYPNGSAGYGGAVPNAAAWPQSGAGGSSPFGGGGGAMPSLVNAQNGADGYGYGSGGSGGCTPGGSGPGGRGGAGRPGFLKIWW